MERPNERTAWEIVVVGTAGIAHRARCEELPTARYRARCAAMVDDVGGKGALQAIAAARLGARVALVSCVGEDAPAEALLARLATEGVSTTYVVRDPNAPTAVDLVVSAERGGSIVASAPGAAARLSAENVRWAREPIQGAKVLLAQLDAPLEALEEAARIANGADVGVVLDAAPPGHLSSELLSLADVVTADAEGAEALTGIEPRDAETAHRVATDLMDRGAAAVAIAAGIDGELFLWKGGERLLSNVPIRPAFASLGEDVFAAGLAVGLAEGRLPPDAGPFAQMAAALAGADIDVLAALPRRELVMEALSRL